MVWSLQGDLGDVYYRDFLPELEQFGYKDILNMVPSSMALVCTERLLYCIWSSVYKHVFYGMVYGMDYEGYMIFRASR